MLFNNMHLFRTLNFQKAQRFYPFFISGENLFHSQNSLYLPRKLPTSKVNNLSNDFPLKDNTPLTVAAKYKVFDDSDSFVIQNTNEEIAEGESFHDAEEYDEFEGLNLKRGLTGVYDIEELVDLLRRENAKDVFVAAVPSMIKYVEYICVVSGHSAKHNLALAEFIRKLFKRKCNESDTLPNIEGKEAKDWLALDLGNIALHIFDNEKRKIYDLETLWSIGHEFDPQCKRQEEHIDTILKKYDIFLEDLKPAK